MRSSLALSFQTRDDAFLSPVVASRVWEMGDAALDVGCFLLVWVMKDS